MEVGNQKHQHKSIWVNENTREVWNGYFKMLSGLTSNAQLMSHYSENIEKKMVMARKYHRAM